jgi:hypothetical protein
MSYVDIACADNLRVLGYLDPRVHILYIDGNVISVYMFSLNLWNIEINLYIHDA